MGEVKLNLNTCVNEEGVCGRRGTYANGQSVGNTYDGEFINYKSCSNREGHARVSDIDLVTGGDCDAGCFVKGCTCGLVVLVLEAMVA